VLAVVQAVGAALPQLDGVGPQAVAAPVVRPRDVAREAPVHLPHPLLELLPVPDHRALGRRPRTELGAARAGGEVGVGLLGGQPLDRTLQPLYRAARLEGPVERLTAEESDAYFATRPRGAQLGAWASAQGTVIGGREELEERVREADRRFPDEVPRPDYWGGYRLRPDAVELWQGRPDRLHDREHFLLQPDGTWRAERLSP